MRILRVFPRRTKATPTDALAFVGDPPLPPFRPPADEVHVSVTFAPDVAEGERLARAWERHYPGRVKMGGPALGDPGGEFIAGHYLKPGYTITSRGCPNNCGFCLVPKREGGIRELPVTDGYDVLDNNLLACRDRHIQEVFEMLKHQRRAARFSGGIDSRLLTPERIEQLRSMRIDELFLAYDAPSAWRRTQGAIRSLRSAGLSRDQVRCYVLGGYANTDTPARWAERCEHVLLAGGLPFAMLYQGEGWGEEEYSIEWLDVRRKYIMPAAMLPAGRRAQLEAARVKR